MDTFSALADPTRRHIIEMLVNKGELSATDISKKFNMSPPAISQHLKVLRDTNIVRVEKRAQQRIYQVNPTAMSDVEEWLKKMAKIWNERFDRLDQLLKEEKRKLRGGE